MGNRFDIKILTQKRKKTNEENPGKCDRSRCGSTRHTRPVWSNSPSATRSEFDTAHNRVYYSCPTTPNRTSTPRCARQKTASPAESAGRISRGGMDRGVARRQCRAGSPPLSGVMSEAGCHGGFWFLGRAGLTRVAPRAIARSSLIVRGRAFCLFRSSRSPNKSIVYTTFVTLHEKEP